MRRYVRYGPPGAEQPGVLDANDAVRDLRTTIADFSGTALDPEALRALDACDPEGLPLANASRLGPPIGAIGKIIGVGLNYRAHAREVGLAAPSEPTLFLKATSSIAGPHDDVLIPRDAHCVDWEVELAVVIGRHGTNVSVEDAMGHVAGYCLAIDFSERDYQFKRGGYATKGKSCDTFAPLGPWFVPAHTITDPMNVELRLSVNGVERQCGNTSDMIFPIADLIAYASIFMSLHPGDVILTGTPPGVGMGQKPAQYLAAGDHVEATIAELGTQRHDVVG